MDRTNSNQLVKSQTVFSIEEYYSIKAVKYQLDEKIPKTSVNHFICLEIYIPTTYKTMIYYCSLHAILHHISFKKFELLAKFICSKLLQKR